MNAYDTDDFDKQVREAAAVIADKQRVNGAEKARMKVFHMPEATTLLGQPFNDSGNADRLIALYGRDLRYCHALRKWLVWDGRRWAIDETGQTVKLAKRCMVEFVRQAVEAGNEACSKFARSCLNAQRIGSALKMAECEIFVTPAELDTDPYLLNFTNGTVDLRTGDLQPHQPEHFITKTVRHQYRRDAQCPLFLRTLARLMGCCPDASEVELERADRLVSYMQKAFGYSLTGSTCEKAVFLCYGSGNNGKTTLLSTVRQIFEEYSTLVQIDSLMAKQENNNSQADLADLRGARFCMTSETEAGQRLSEGKLKRITQGMGKIKAARKYENHVEFPETHKLWMDANHLPIVRGTDEAIWNRLYPIPFTVTVPAEEIDRELPGKLLCESEGIVAWVVEGAVRWTSEGLGKPPEVAEAVESYRNQMDQVGRFIEECCIVLSTAKVKAHELYLNYREWSEGAGEHAIAENVFADRLTSRTSRGIRKSRGNAGVQYFGLGLKSDPNV